MVLLINFGSLFVKLYFLNRKIFKIYLFTSEQEIKRFGSDRLRIRNTPVQTDVANMQKYEEQNSEEQKYEEQKYEEQKYEEQKRGKTNTDCNL